MNKFVLGILSAITGLGLLAPAFATVASAAATSSATTTTSSAAPAVAYTQPCIDALKAADTARLAGLDVMFQTQKAELTAHLGALQATLSIADPVLRATAMKKVETDARTASKAQLDAGRTANHTAMTAVKTACAADPAFLADHSGKRGGMMKGGFEHRGMKGGMKEGHGFPRMKMKPTTGTSSSNAN